MAENIEKLFTTITKSNTEESVHNEVDNAKSEFVYDWEDDFESLEDAYEEQGRGEAESQTLRDLINENGGADLSTDDHCELFTNLAEHYYLTTS